MSQENVEIVRELYEGWTRGDFRVGLDHFGHDFRFIIDTVVSPTPGEWRGVDAMRKSWRQQLEPWDGYRTGPIEHLIESGDDVVALSRQHGRGKHSGVEIDSGVWAAVFSFRDGKIVRLLLTDLQGGLKAVGLSE
jgi:ketosteroid isomerase-like protein